MTEKTDDKDYQQMRYVFGLKTGDRIPYREYAYQRCLYYIGQLSTDEQLDTIQKQLDLRRQLHPHEKTNNA